MSPAFRRKKRTVAARRQASTGRRAALPLKPRPDWLDTRLFMQQLEDRSLLSLDFSTLGQDLATDVGTVQAALNTSLQAMSYLPIIGSKIADNAQLQQVVGQLNAMATNLENAGNALAGGASDTQIASAIQSNLFTELGPSGPLPLLAALDGGSEAPQSSDVSVLTPETSGSGLWDVKMLLREQLATSVPFDLGTSLGDFLKFSTNGNVTLAVTSDYLLEFTINPATSEPTLVSTNLHNLPQGGSALPDTPLDVTLGATLGSGFSADATLNCLLYAQVTDDDPTKEPGTHATSLTASLGIDPGNSGNDSLSVNAHLGLHLKTTFGDPNAHLPINPEIDTDFHLDWNVNTATPADRSSYGSPTNVGFDAVMLNIGSLGSLIDNIVSDVQQVTEPLQPLVQVLTTPIPGLDKLGLDLDLAHVVNPDGTLEKALQVIKTINGFHSSGGGGLPVNLGSFTLDGNALLNDLAGGATPTIATSDATDASDLAADAAADPAISQAQQASSGNGGGFQFPVLTNPAASAFQMLVGQNVDLFTFTLPSLSFSTSLDIPLLPILPPLVGISLVPSASVSLGISVGYDTAGITEMANDVRGGVTDPGQLTADLADGFYINNKKNSDGFPATGIDVAGDLDLAATVVVVQVTGGLGADVDLHFAGSDKVRLNELQLAASGSIFVEAGVKFGLSIGVSFVTLASFPIARITLISFDSSPKPVYPDGPGGTSNQTIHIDPYATDSSGGSEPETVTARMAKLPMSQVLAQAAFGIDVYGVSDPNATVECIEVDYYDEDYSQVDTAGNIEDSNATGMGVLSGSEIYPVYLDYHDSSGIEHKRDLAHYNLISMDQSASLDDPLKFQSNNGQLQTMVAQQKVIVGDLQGDSEKTPVNAVLIGGPGNDNLDYHGEGSAVLVGGGGQNKLVADNSDSPRVAEFGDTIAPGTFDLASLRFPLPGDVLAALESQVAPLASAGAANQLTAAGADEFLEGGTGDNTFDGSPSASYLGGAGTNVFGVRLSQADPNAPVAAGEVVANPLAKNSLVLDRTNATMPAGGDDLALSAAGGANGAYLLVTGYLTNLAVTGLSDTNSTAITVDTNGGTLQVGDVSSLGTFHVLVNGGGANAPVTHVVMKTPADGLAGTLSVYESAEYTALPVLNETRTNPGQIPAQYDVPAYIDPQSEVFPYVALQQGDGTTTPGANLDLFGFTSQDDATVFVQGGTVSVGDLAGGGLGALDINGTLRPTSAPSANQVAVAVNSGDNVSMAPDSAGDSVLKMSAGYQVGIQGDLPVDNLSLNLNTTFSMYVVDDKNSAFTAYYNNPPLTPVLPTSLEGDLAPYLSYTDKYAPDPDIEGNIDIIANSAPYWDETRSFASYSDGSTTAVTASPPAGTPTSADLDASALVGTFNVAVADPNYAHAQQLADIFATLNQATAISVGPTNITLSHVNPGLAVTIQGDANSPPTSGYSFAISGDTQTQVTIGEHALASIEHNVTVSNAQLTIDDSAATTGGIMTLTANTFRGWNVPGTSLAPTLNFSGLYGNLTVDAGAGDQFDVEATPPGIASGTLNNATTMRDPVYAVGWNIPLAVNGDFDIYFGWRILPDGTIVKVNTLAPLPATVTFDFSTVNALATQVVLDGDADPAGASYTIGGNGDLEVANQTVGLSVIIAGFRDQDLLLIRLPGGTVNADLTATSPGTINLDSTARENGVNALAPDNITITNGAGNVALQPVASLPAIDTLQPVNGDASVLGMFNTVILQNANTMTQDSLTVQVPTVFKMAAPPIASTYTIVAQSFVSSVYWTATVPPPDYVRPEINVFAYGPVTVPSLLLGSMYMDRAQLVDHYETGLDFVPSPGAVSEGLHDVGVPARGFPSTSSPAAVNNNTTLNAAGLRGQLKFNVLSPDYELVQNTIDAFIYVIDTDGVNAFTAFSQTPITLTNVNSQLAVAITGANYTPGSLNGAGEFPTHITTYPKTSVELGAGTLANIQGDVSIDQAQIIVDDGRGANSNILTLTGTTLTGWATTAGLTHPTLTVGGAVGQELDIITAPMTAGAPGDNLDIEGTPSSATQTVISNSGATGPTEVYVMGQGSGQGASSLYVNGDFNLHVGDRLNADGTVTDAGLVDGLLQGWSLGWNQPGNILVPPIVYNYSGSGTGEMTFDVAHDTLANEYANPILGSHTFSAYQILGYDGIIPSSLGANVYAVAYPGDALAQFLGMAFVAYGPDTEVTYDNPILAAKVFDQFKISSPFAPPVHYIANAASDSTSSELVQVLATQGPLTVQGSGGNSRAIINNQISASGSSIAGNVDVRNAALTVYSYSTAGGLGSPLVDQPPATLTQNTISGVTGGLITYSALTDISLGADPYTAVYENLDGAGLALDWAYSFKNPLIIQNTPGGATTEITSSPSNQVFSPTLGAIQVLATTGDLLLSYVYAPSGYDSVSFPPSITVGDGDLEHLAGAVSIDTRGTPIPITVDDHADPQGRQVALANVSGPQPFIYSDFAITGMAPAGIYLVAEPSALSILGGAGSTFTVTGLIGAYAPPPGVTIALHATEDSTVNVAASALQGLSLSNLNIIGAGAVNVDGSVLDSNFKFGNQIAIMPDRARPLDPVALAVTGLHAGSLDNVANGQDGIEDDQGVVGILFPAATTHVTLSTNDEVTHDSYGNVYSYSAVFYVNDSGGGGTTINPAAEATVYDPPAAVFVMGADGPIQINQPSTGTARVVVGNNGSTQSISAPVTIAATDATLGSLAVTVDDAADTNRRTIKLSSTEAADLVLTGIALGEIDVLGGAANLTISGGLGGNVYEVADALALLVTLQGAGGADLLRGPDLPNTWSLTGANAGTLDGNLAFTAVPNLLGGSNVDDFIFARDNSVGSTGSVTGNLDGGPGIDTLDYSAIAAHLTAAQLAALNLAQGTAPLIGGQVRHIERVLPLTLTNPGPQPTLDTVNFSLSLSGIINPAPFINSVGLPLGLSVGHVDADTLGISGAIPQQPFGAPPYQGTVDVTDDYDNLLASFPVALTASFAVANIGPQTNSVGDTVNLSLPVSGNLPSTPTAVVNGLPPGLTATLSGGAIGITGTIAQLPFRDTPYQVSVSLSDADGTFTDSFAWTVTAPPLVITNPGDQTNNLGDSVEVQLSVPNPRQDLLSVAALGLPPGLTAQVSGNTYVNIIGTINAQAALNTPYQVTLDMSAGASTGSISFKWTVTDTAPVLNGVPSALEGWQGEMLSGQSLYPDSFNPIGLYLGVRYKIPVIITASNLPAGLSLTNVPNSGAEITGAIAANASSENVTITVSDGKLQTTYNFPWVVAPSRTVAVTLGDNQAATIGQFYAAPLVVQVTDANGNPVAYAPVQLVPPQFVSPTVGASVILGGGGTIGPNQPNFDANTQGPRSDAIQQGGGGQGGGGGGNAGPITIYTDASGFAQMPPLMANYVAGHFTVSAFIDGDTTPAVFHLDNLPFGGNGAVTLASIPDQASPEGSSVSLPIVLNGVASDAVFFADNLPAGLSINSQTGLISGTVAPQTTESSNVLAAGYYSVTVGVYCNSGSSEDTTYFNWTVQDVTPPNTSIVSMPPFNDNNASPTFLVTGGDNDTSVLNLTYGYSLDGNQFSPVYPDFSGPNSGDASIGFSNLSDGSHTLQVWAIDQAGNQGTPVSYTWTIDTTPPVASALFLAAYETNSQFTVPFDTFDATSQTLVAAELWYTANGGVTWTAFGNVSGGALSSDAPFTFTAPAGGVYGFYVQAQDGAGNVNLAPVGPTFIQATTIVDTAPPVSGTVFDGAVIGVETAAQTSAAALSANWIGFSDPESGIADYQWAIGTTPGGADVQPFTDVGLATSAAAGGFALTQGQTYFVTVKATDAAGLSSTATSSGVTFKPLAAPTLSDLDLVYTGAVLGAQANTTPTGLPVVLTYTTNGQPVVPINAGAYQVTATVASADYQGGSTATFWIEQAMPQINLTAAGGSYTGNAFNASASVVGVDGVTPVPGTLSYTYYSGNAAVGIWLPGAPAAPGAYTVAVSFTSGDPNYNDASATQTFVIGQPGVSVKASNYSGNLRTLTYTRTLTITNNGAQAITGPISIELAGLNISLLSASSPNVGTSISGPAGDPVIQLALSGTNSLAAGGSITVVLKLSDAARIAVTNFKYTTIVQGGV